MGILIENKTKEGNVKNWHKARINNIQDRIDWLENNTKNWTKVVDHPVEATRFQAEFIINRNNNEIEVLQNKLDKLQNQGVK